MARSKNPVITAKEIRDLKPGETLTLKGVTEKGRSCITSMIGYIKDMGLPKYIVDYATSYSRKTGKCLITALRRGMNKKDYRGSAAREEEDRPLDKP